MNLAAGSRLGPYEILSPLGAGGMGEVYRARDVRLGREVAVKVLPEDLARDPERLRRFEGEARAASALSDPHIVAVYDVGEANNVHFFASELVEGLDLRRLIDAGPAPIKKTLDVAEQIASGLAAAHEKGIVHRDLKPENVLITKAGVAKIADFGLAKLTEPSERSVSQLPTTDGHQTTAGVVMGTVAYMSPEQAQGKPVDFRTDQFSFGTVLYEMLTGKRPFANASPPETLTAVIREEPEPLEKAAPNVPAPVRWIVERCLAKDPSERFSSTSDLAKELQDLRSHLSEAVSTHAASGNTPRLRRRLPLAASLGLAAVCAGAAYFAAVRTAPRAQPSYRPLTFRRGIITGAAFGADGKTVYYSAAFGGESSRVYVTRIDGTESSPLDLPPAILLSVSRNNELAVLLTEERVPHNSYGTLARVPALGGTPRTLADDAIDADWAPDGERMVVSRGSRRQLEFPLGQPLPASSGQDPRLSPTGKYVAFGARGGINISDLTGQIVVRQQTAWQFGKAWAPSGRELWITMSRTGGGFDRALYSLSLTGKLRLIARAPTALTVWAVGPDGRSALLSTGAAWIGINAARVGAAREARLDLLGRTFVVGISADGQWVLEQELREVGGGAYLRSSDGSRIVRLGSGLPLGISPDGARVLLWDPSDKSLQIVPTGPGVPHAVPWQGLGIAAEDMIRERHVYSRAQWSRDGGRLFLALAAGQSAAQIYMREREGSWRAITSGLASNRFAVSPDGRQVAVRDIATGVVSVCSVDRDPPLPLAGEKGIPILWSADGRWLYLQRAGRNFPLKIYRREIVTGRIEPWRDFAPDDLEAVLGVGDMLLSGDAQTYVYSYQRGFGELYLAQGLR